MKGVGALACCGVLSRVQVRVNPCSARGGADQLHAEKVRLRSHGEVSHPLSVSTLLMCRRVDELQDGLRQQPH